MTFITQPIPDDKRAMVQAKSDLVDPGGYATRWALNSDSGDYLICMSWETGRGDPRGPGLWLYVNGNNTIILHIMADDEWGPHIEGIHTKFTVHRTIWGATEEKDKARLQKLITNALHSVGMSMHARSKVEITF